MKAYMVDKMAITRVFEVLGAERVARGLATRRHTWADCFLALAYGVRGELARAVDDGLRGAARLFRPPMALKVAKLLGVPPGAVVAVVDAFDHSSAEFRRLAEEWLEENKDGAGGVATARPSELERADQAEWKNARGRAQFRPRKRAALHRRY